MLQKDSTCQGRRYRDDILEFTYHGLSIHAVLDMRRLVAGDIRHGRGTEC